MIAFVVRPFPPDPATDLKNFQRKQAEYEAAFHRTGELFVLYEPLLHAQAAKQGIPDWVVTAVGIMRGRTADIAERFKERMRHVRRYRCVRDWRNRHPDGSDALYTKNQALKLAAAQLEAAGEAAQQRPIAKLSDRVSRDLTRKGCGSELV